MNPRFKISTQLPFSILPSLPLQQPDGNYRVGRTSRLCLDWVSLVVFINEPDFLHGFIIAQSICTHYSLFENMGQFATLKKNWVQNMGCKIWGSKNRVIVIQKEKRPGCLFLNNKMTLFFAPCFFAPHPFFLSSRPKKKYEVDLIN